MKSFWNAGAGFFICGMPLLSPTLNSVGALKGYISRNSTPEIYIYTDASGIETEFGSQLSVATIELIR